MTRTFAAMAAFAILVGCAGRHPRAPSTAAPGSDAAACRLDLLKVLEGRPGSAVLAAQALQLSGARTVRWMHPGDMVTMDLQPDRLNIKLTKSNIVKSFACG